MDDNHNDAQDTPTSTDPHRAQRRPAQILRLPAVMERTGLSRSAVYLGISKGAFPAGVKYFGRSTGWDADAVDSWVRARLGLAVDGGDA